MFYFCPFPRIGEIPFISMEFLQVINHCKRNSCKSILLTINWIEYGTVDVTNSLLFAPIHQSNELISTSTSVSITQ